MPGRWTVRFDEVGEIPAPFVRRVSTTCACIRVPGAYNETLEMAMLMVKRKEKATRVRFSDAVKEDN